jgi:hypothetical protein
MSGIFQLTEQLIASEGSLGSIDLFWFLESSEEVKCLSYILHAYPVNVSVNDSLSVFNFFFMFHTLGHADINICDIIEFFNH